MSTKGGLVLFLKKGCREAPAKATKYIQPNSFSCRKTEGQALDNAENSIHSMISSVPGIKQQYD
jgi:hypothetical protein